MKSLQIIVIIIVAAFLSYLLIKGKRVKEYVLPNDIKTHIDEQFPNPNEKQEVLGMMKDIGQNSFNVGKDQLIRSILIIAQNDKSKIKRIIDSDYYGDPRDVIMEAMGVPGNNNDHGITPFK